VNHILSKDALLSIQLQKSIIKNSSRTINKYTTKLVMFSVQDTSFIKCWPDNSWLKVWKQLNSLMIFWKGIKALDSISIIQLWAKHGWIYSKEWCNSIRKKELNLLKSDNYWRHLKFPLISKFNLKNKIIKMNSSNPLLS